MFQPLSYISRGMIAAVLASEQQERAPLTVCFTGHRGLTATEAQDLPNALDELVDALYRRGYRAFLCGGALGFDTLAAEAVIRLKRKHCDARLNLALPCPTQSSRWPQADCVRYERILYASDKTDVVSSCYFSGCMQMRNRFMVDRCDLCVAYLVHMRGGTLSTVRYALEKGVQMLNIGMPGACEAFVRETAGSL